jgi:hypothetical protein
MRITILEVIEIINKIKKDKRTGIESVLSRFDEFTLLLFILINNNISDINHEDNNNDNYYRYVPDGTYNMDNLTHSQYFMIKCFPYIYGNDVSNINYNFEVKENKDKKKYLKLKKNILN